MVNETNVFQNNNPLLQSKNLRHETQGTVLQEFYRGAHVLVTGATGFMGKVLVEKLLRSCPNIERIFLLVRAKKGRSVEERIDDLVGSHCFSQLLLQNQKLKSKLVAISGDIGTDGLGINDADRRLLNDVSVVFHLAATVRFDEQLKIAINQNVRGTRDVLILCRSFNKLKSVIYVSTVYSNYPNETIKECLYDPPIPCEDAISMVSTANVDVLNKIMPSLLGKWPNTYTFSKAIAEDAVRSYGRGLPVGVFRPAIVACSMHEPVPGYTDSLYGPMGLSLGMGSGVIRTLRADPDAVCNLLPCDMAINGLIAAAWDIAENKLPTEVPVYNFTVPKENVHSTQAATNFQLECAVERPTMKALWHMSVFVTANKLLVTIFRTLFHILPAILYDLFRMASLKKPTMVQMYKKIHTIIDALHYFSVRTWLFEVKNVDNMWKKLAPSDQSIFNFDMRDIDWVTYHRNAWTGIRAFLAKESPASIPAARIRARKLYWLHRATQLVLMSMSAYYISSTAMSAVFT